MSSYPSDSQSPASAEEVRREGGRGRRSEAQSPAALPSHPTPVHTPRFPWRSRCAVPRPPPPPGAPSCRRPHRPRRGGSRGGRPPAGGATATTATTDFARATTTSPSSSARRTSRMDVSALSSPPHTYLLLPRVLGVESVSSA